MNQEINDDEVLSDSPSNSTSRRSSSASSDMPKTNIRSRPGSIQRGETFIDRQSLTIDNNDLPSPSKQQQQQQAPIKVLVFNGKCSKVFKSTIEDCVEDCILEFSGENSVYVPKSGQPIQMPTGTTRNSIISFREQNTNAQQSARSNRRRSSSINQYNSLPQLGGSGRTSLTNSFTSPTTSQPATTATRIRQQKFSLVEDISEESIEQQPAYEPEERSQHPSLLPDEPNSPGPNQNLSSSSVPAFSYYKLPTAKTHVSYRDRQKDYRLSDLVMLGPEYFTHVFNLPRSLRSNNPTQSQSNIPKQRLNKTAEKYNELDRIKQDLFHRYLWTQNPQVSCRIRPLSTYPRSTTFV